MGRPRGRPKGSGKGTFERDATGRRLFLFICEFCGSEFKRTQKLRFCSPVCASRGFVPSIRHEAEFERRRSLRPWLTCEQCGKRWQQNKSGSSRRSFRFCSHACSGIAHRGPRVQPEPEFSPVYPMHCSVCLLPFVARTKGPRSESCVCSERCLKERERVRAAIKCKSRHIETTCQECGHSFTAFEGRKYCSKRCVVRVHKRTRKAWEKTRRRGERVCFKAVWDLTGGRCYICDHLCYLTNKAPHPLAPTVEHKVPLSLGGEHTLQNCGIAHFICNAFKNNFLDSNIYRDKCLEAVKAISRGEDGWQFHPLKNQPDRGHVILTAKPPNSAEAAVLENPSNVKGPVHETA